MNAHTWHEAFSQAYTAFRHQVASGSDPIIDPYAAENPAEFFAVLSEAFFDSPTIIQQHFTAVYQQLVLFYRQDPARRQVAF